MDNPIIFDLETTGLSSKEDEILQVSIIDIKGNVLFNKYIRPTRAKEWPKAMEVNGITPEMVSACEPFYKYKEQIQKIFDDCDGFITYNGTFDLRFLEANGIAIPNRIHLDAMKSFAYIWSDKKNGNYKWQKLTTAAKYYNIKFDAHNALADSEATRLVALKMYGNDLNYDPFTVGKVKLSTRVKDLILGRRIKKFFIKKEFKK